MKNMFKMLGIVAILAMIVLAVGCGPVDPEDQTIITVTGIDSSFNNKYAMIALVKNVSASDDITAQSSYPKKISGGSVIGEMEDDKGAWGKEDAYFVRIEICETVDDFVGDAADPLYNGITTSAQPIKKGAVTVTADKFRPDNLAESATAQPPSAEDKIATFLGTYKVTYKVGPAGNAKSIDETIDLTDVEKFKISDNDGDSLEFTITDWDYSATPNTYIANYPNAFKFQGKITKSTTGYYGTDSQTGKGITASDIKADGTGTLCWMYLYFSDDGTSVIRTPFTKTGTTTENKDVVLHYTSTGAASSGQNGPLRVYTKQP